MHHHNVRMSLAARRQHLHRQNVTVQQSNISVSSLTRQKCATSDITSDHTTQTLNPGKYTGGIHCTGTAACEVDATQIVLRFGGCYLWHCGVMMGIDGGGRHGEWRQQAEVRRSENDRDMPNSRHSLSDASATRPTPPSYTPKRNTTATQTVGVSLRCSRHRRLNCVW